MTLETHIQCGFFLVSNKQWHRIIILLTNRYEQIVIVQLIHSTFPAFPGAINRAVTAEEKCRQAEKSYLDAKERADHLEGRLNDTKAR